jgi:ATP synthase protein I
MTDEMRPEGRPPEEPRRPAASEKRDDGPSAGAYAGLGLQFAASILVFLYLGQWLDRRLGTDPWLLLIGVFVGAGGSFYSIYRKLMREQERDEARKRERSGRP